MQWIDGKERRVGCHALIPRESKLILTAAVRGHRSLLDRVRLPPAMSLDGQERVGFILLVVWGLKVGAEACCECKLVFILCEFVGVVIDINLLSFHDICVLPVYEHDVLLKRIGAYQNKQ